MNIVVLVVWSGIFLLGLSIGLLVNINTEQPCSLSCSVPDPTWDPKLGNFLMPEAGAEGELEWYPSISQPPNELAVLNSILTEEKKQTALLDHIDCLTSTYNGDCGGKYYAGDTYKRAIPLNKTGVWKR